ncbi:MAG: SAM-dependent methyltransferase [Mycobacteriaceae bacterium]|nr:SAM-dependent methyltransferase [Mycobacteriaceae bacterium]
MDRTDSDSWEITESVGATALAVAAARAAETESANPLISDPFARVFTDAVGDGGWNWYAAPELPAEVIEAAPDLPLRMQTMLDYFASRTAFFDSFFLDATNTGIRQVVILAAGLDARSWRLPWPAGVTVYELDQPAVLQFKEATLRDHGAEPTCRRIGVPVDLRQDWPSALQQAGLDASALSTWSAEGLLPYLPAAAQDLLFERVHALAVRGSRIAIEAFGSDSLNAEFHAQRRASMDRVRAVMTTVDPSREIPRTDELWYYGEREDAGDWFSRHGWQVAVTAAKQLLASYGRKPAPQIDDFVLRSSFVSAQRE